MRSSQGVRILVVRLGSMGDVLHTLPAAATLKHSYPGSHLTWVVDPKWAVLLEGNPFVDRCVLLDRHTLSSVVAAWRDLRACPFDLAVDFQGLIKSALVASAARPDRLFGFHQSQLRERAAALFYSNRVSTAASHVVDMNLELASAAGAASILRAFPLPEGKPEGVLPEGDFVLASPLAGWKSKQWPMECYGVLARRLREELGVPLVLDGPPGAAEALASVAGVQRHVSSVAGLIHATRRAAAVVGIDSGPMHLAAALGKPGVAIFGPTDPARNGPYGGSLAVLRSPRAVTSYKRRKEIDESMRQVSPEQVFKALRASLAGEARSVGCPA